MPLPMTCRRCREQNHRKGFDDSQLRRISSFRSCSFTLPAKAAGGRPDKLVRAPQIAGGAASNENKAQPQE